ncbi:MAG: sulfite exporter TauE/SafE family protein [Clostridia bacterium]|nr:sulfite exporter TauE/SafE family protein [Clostridia bacterium]
MKLILIGLISGIVTGLGMGGGSILILLLTIFMSVEQHTAQASNLIFFIATAMSAIIVHIKIKNINPKVGKKLLFSIIIGSACGAYLTQFVDSSHLRKYFGIFLLVVAILEIIQLIKKYLLERRGNNVKK